MSNNKWTVTTSDGRRYRYADFESAVVAARNLFGWDGYTITRDDDETFQIKSKYHEKPEKL